jgi:hypothetical protein
MRRFFSRHSEERSDEESLSATVFKRDSSLLSK